MYKMYGVLVVLCCVATSSLVADEPPKEDGSEMVTVADIRRGVMGDLGHPLGSIVTVKGLVLDGDDKRMKAYSGDTLLRVEEVNGASLKTPVEYRFRSSDLERPEPGTRFAYIAYETGAYRGAPEGLFEYVPIYATTGFHFETELSLIAIAE